MARGGPERKAGRRRHTEAVTAHAGQLALLRQQLDGMRGSDPAFAATLNQAIGVSTELLGKSTRMSRGGLSRRAACENIVTTSVLDARQANERTPMSYEAPSFTATPEAGPDQPVRRLHLVPPVGATAVAEAVSHYDDEATGTDQLPFTD